MYEAEINQPSVLETALPAAIRNAFRSPPKTIKGRTVLPWGEHCTECVMPSCYRTCDLYVPRKDGKCRRFVDGIVRIDEDESLYGYILKIQFKRWAKLWTVGSTRIFPLTEARALEHQDRAVAERLGRISILPLQVLKIRQRYEEKKRRALQTAPIGEEQPDYFLIECYNPSPALVSVSLVMRAINPKRGMPFQRLMEMSPGFNRVQVTLAEITPVLNTAEPFGVDIIPNTTEEPVTLYFGSMDFVRDSAFVRPEAPCKVVVWDLDGTLWDGTLVEDGLSNLVLKPGIREVLAELDRRGILLSIASKNDAEDGLAALQKFDLEEYFLYPQISWHPKSHTLPRIAAALNVGLDSIAFIDDSAFEQESVRSACPQVRVFDATEYQSLLARPEFPVAAPAHSVSRKDLYRLQQVREVALNSDTGTYQEFLRDSRLELTVARLSADNIARVHELTQRTNQMNFSGTRYSRQTLDAILENPRWDTYVIDCRDRFGTYGTVGFCLVDRQARLATDLMFSCRVQSKQVEHAFLIYLLRKYRSDNPGDFCVSYRRTARNANVGKVFDDLRFETLSEKDGTAVLIFRAHREIPENSIVAFVEQTSM